MTALADFEIRAELGQGGSAVVYDATFEGRRVALKVLREELALSEREKQRFVDEARRMVKVEHEGLVKLERAGVLPDGRPFLAMPFVDGRTLAQRLAEGPIAPAEAVRVFGVLARAVGALHAAGIVHRDIKPENILLVEDDDGTRPVLLDLGIARDADGGPSTTTQAGKIRGTPAYMAPERFFGTPASPQSDVYELGVTFYMMLVGRLPWGTAENVEERLSPRGPDAYQPGIGPGLARAVLRALSTRAEARPAGASVFAEEIERAFALGVEEVAQKTTETILKSVPPPAAIESGVSVASTLGSIPPAAAMAPTVMSPITRRRRVMWYALPMVGVAGAASLWLARGPVGDAGTIEGSQRAAAATTAIPVSTTAASASAPTPSPAPRASAEPIASSHASAAAPMGSVAERAGAKPGRPRGATTASAPAKPAPAPGADPFLEDRR